MHNTKMINSQLGGIEQTEEETEPQHEEDNVTPREPETHTRFSIDDYEFTALPAPEEYVASITPLGWLGSSHP